MKRTLQPRKKIPIEGRLGDGEVTADLLHLKGRPMRAGYSEGRPCASHRGREDGTEGKDREIKVGNLTVVVAGVTPRQRPGAIKDESAGSGREARMRPY